MSRYHHRKDGTPVMAVQFTDEKSIKKIVNDFRCDVISSGTGASILIDDNVKVWRGQYAVLAMCAIVAMDQKTFDERFKLDETQLEIFDELR